LQCVEYAVFLIDIATSSSWNSVGRDGIHYHVVEKFIRFFGEAAGHCQEFSCSVSENSGIRVPVITLNPLTFRLSLGSLIVSSASEDCWDKESSLDDVK
jgi:hypothetical protein